MVTMSLQTQEERAMRFPIELVLLVVSASVIAGLVNQSVVTALVTFVLAAAGIAVVETVRRTRRES